MPRASRYHTCSQDVTTVVITVKPSALRSRKHPARLDRGLVGGPGCNLHGAGTRAPSARSARSGSHAPSRWHWARRRAPGAEALRTPLVAPPPGQAGHPGHRKWGGKPGDFATISSPLAWSRMRRNPTENSRSREFNSSDKSWPRSRAPTQPTGCGNGYRRPQSAAALPPVPRASQASRRGHPGHQVTVLDLSVHFRKHSRGLPWIFLAIRVFVCSLLLSLS